MKPKSWGLPGSYHWSKVIDPDVNSTIEVIASLGDNRAMIRRLIHMRNWLTLLLVLPLAACGWAEWPPAEDGGSRNSRPVLSRNTAAAFIAADAVIVGKGDTIYSISRRHKVSVRGVIEANNLTPPYFLKIGQRLVLPRRPVYIIKRGDTLSQIAQAHNVNMYDLARINSLSPPYVIHIDQRLLLPGLGRKTAAVQSTATRQSERLPPKRESISVPAQRKTAKAVTAPPPTSGKGFLWPVRGRVISSFGGKSKGLQNDGINIQANRGDPVRAVEHGVVAYAGNELRGFGNLLLIKHSGGWVTAYAHNDVLMVKRGDKITKGQKIAKVGSTGSVTSPQLHFELRQGKQAVDPLKHLPKPNA